MKRKDCTPGTTVRYVMTQDHVYTGKVVRVDLDTKGGKLATAYVDFGIHRERRIVISRLELVKKEGK